MYHELRKRGTSLFHVPLSPLECGAVPRRRGNARLSGSVPGTATRIESMKITGATALVTGANRGLGHALVDALRGADCRKVYAGARRVTDVARDNGIEPIELDITNAHHVAAAAARCSDVTILINNAGVAGFSPALGAPTIDTARREMETNYFGTLAMCRAFASVLRRNGGGALVNVLSV